MEMEARKYDLIQALVDMQDIGLIQKLESVMQSHQLNSKDWWDGISDGEKKAIEEGKSQLDRGEGISHDEMRKRIEAQLEKGV